MKKEIVAKFPQELREVAAGESFTKSAYIEKYGGTMPLPTLLPLIFGAVGEVLPVSKAPASEVVAVTTERSEPSPVPAQRSETAVTTPPERSDAGLRDVARVIMKGNLVDDDDVRKVKKYVAYLQNKGFGFYS